MADLLSAAIFIGFHGLAFAMVLYLISVGLSVTMGLMGFVNLAHGVFAVAGGYALSTLISRWSIPYPFALVLAVGAVAAGSVVLERLLYRRLYGAGELDQVLLTIGLAFMSVAIGKYVWGPASTPVRLPAELVGHVEIGGRDFPTYRTFLIVCGGLLVIGLWLAIDRTRFGARLRAAVDNLRMAQSIGINTSLLFTLTFALGSGLAALGGALGADVLSIHPAYALEHLPYFLIVVSVGGLGSIRGPFAAALCLGFADTALKYLVPDLGAFIIYAMTMALLLWRPRGLFGHA